MSPSSTPNSSTFTTPVSTPPREQTSPSKDLGILDYNGKRYKVTVIYTDETGKVVDGPKDIDVGKVIKLTKNLLSEIPDIEKSANITIDENSVTSGEAAIPHNPKTQEIWNSLYTELTTTKEKKPSNDASRLSTKVILEEVSEPTLESYQKRDSIEQFKKVLTELTEKNSSKEGRTRQATQSISVEDSKSEAAESTSSEGVGALVELPLTNEEKKTTQSIKDYFETNEVGDELQSLLDACITVIDDSSAYANAERLADDIKAGDSSEYVKYTEEQKNQVLAFIKSSIAKN